MKKNDKLELVIEPECGHILYQDGERLNYLAETSVLQSAEKHDALTCTVSAEIICWKDGRENTCSFKDGKLILPSGNPVRTINCECGAPVEDDITRVFFVVDAKIKTP